MTQSEATRIQERLDGIAGDVAEVKRDIAVLKAVSAIRMRGFWVIAGCVSACIASVVTIIVTKVMP